eukprot:160732-Prymnesium_polylepis.2
MRIARVAHLLRPARGLCSDASRCAPLRDAYSALVRSEHLRQDATQQAAIDVLQRWEAGDGKRGAYLHGPVGSGKSMMMDLLHETTEHRPRVRLHFHELMLEVHKQLHQLHASRPKRVVHTQDGLPIWKYGAAPSAASDVTAAPGAAGAEAPAPRVEPTAEEGNAADAATAADAAEGKPPPPPEPPPEPHPLEVVAEALLPRDALLCLDEMQVRTCRAHSRHVCTHHHSVAYASLSLSRGEMRPHKSQGG